MTKEILERACKLDRAIKDIEGIRGAMQHTTADMKIIIRPFGEKMCFDYNIPSCLSEKMLPIVDECLSELRREFEDL